MFSNCLSKEINVLQYAECSFDIIRFSFCKYSHSRPKSLLPNDEQPVRPRTLEAYGEQRYQNVRLCARRAASHSAVQTSPMPVHHSVYLQYRQDR